MKHKLLSIILSVSLIATLCNTSMVFASSEIMLSDNVALLSLEQTPNLQKMVLSENGNITNVTIQEDSHTVTTTLEKAETGREDFFIVDKDNNTLYSSITGKTISLDSVNDTEISLFSSAPDTGSLKISYKTMYDALGAVSEIITVASLILTIMSSQLPYPPLTTAALLVDTFSYALTMIMNKIPSKETKKGGQVKYEKVTYTKHQAGQVFHTYKYKVTDLGAY